MELETVAYGGWERCYRMTNGEIELIITGDVGPRIIRLGFVGEENLFKEYPEMMGKTGGDAWRIYGGHRFWHAPEHRVRTYLPDNADVAVGMYDGVVEVIQPEEGRTGLQKSLDIVLAPDENKVTVTHRITNKGLWPVTLAPWALSVMAAGGVGIVPLPPRGSHDEHLLPTTSLAIWPYVNMGDKRWTWGEKYILLRQDSAATGPQKIGVACSPGWVGYWRAGYLFIKQFVHQPEATYPDMNSSAELFTDADMLEVETLGPLAEVVPGGSIEHVETWRLFADVPNIEADGDVEAYVRPLV